ncbi:hypothetical protein ACYT4K_00155 [Lactococcus lactis]|nr:hypothetical protein [Lactococcus lactis]QLF89776.1 hypothetical protein HPC60_03295 [Lactococcus lactis subsp. lactis]
MTPITTKITGVEEVKDLITVVKYQVSELENTLNKLSKAKIDISIDVSNPCEGEKE